MKKTAVFLSAMLSLSLTVTGCSAADSEAWKSNTGTINLSEMTVTGNGIKAEGNQINITQGGDFEVMGTLSDGMIYVNTEERVKLRLSGASITNSSGPAIYFDNTDKGFITITEGTQNYLEDGKTYTDSEADAALFSNDDLEIKGDGTLNIVANYKHGIASDDDLNIENGVISVTSYEHGIKVNNTLNVLGGTIKIVAETGKGMKGEEAVIIDGGVIDIESKDNEGIESKGTLTVNNGEINIVAKEDGLNTGNADTTKTETTQPTEKNTDTAQNPQMNNGEMPRRPEGGFRGGRRGEMNGEMPTIPERPQNANGGTQTPPQRPENGENRTNVPPENGGNKGFGGMGGGGFGRIDEETAAAHAITINGGKIYINAGGDGIDSNGSLTINGGEITIDGPENSGNGSLDSEGTMAINGGTVIATSSAGMVQLPRSTDGQKIVSVRFTETQAAGTKITVKNADGEEIMNFTPQKKYQMLIFACGALENEKTYTVYLNDEKYEEFTMTENMQSVGNAAGGRGFGGGMGGNRENMTSRGSFDRTQQNIKVNVNGAQVKFNTQPTIKNDTTLVGYRAIMEALGAEVTWNGETRTVTAVKDDVVIVLTIDSNTASVNGEEYTLLTAPEIINNETQVPVRFISENLGMDVQWDGNTRQISVNSKK